MCANMNIIIVEPNASGHHMELYVRHATRLLLQSGFDISLLTTKSAVAHPSFKSINESFNDNIKLYIMPELPKSKSKSVLILLIIQIISWIKLHREYVKIKNKNRIDVVYVPTLDWIGKATEILGSPFSETPFVALYISPKHHLNEMGLGPPGRMDWLYNKLFQRLLKIKTLRQVLVIDEYFYKYCIKNYGPLSKKLQYIPDFSEVKGSDSKEKSRHQLGISFEKKILLVYGSLTRRKGIFQLIDAFLESDLPSNFILLFSGKADDEIRELMKTPKVIEQINLNRIVLKLYFHNEEEEYRVFKASDYCWLGYVSGFFASSGVLYQCASIGLPVIAMQNGIIGHAVKNNSLGLLIDPNDKNSIINALMKAGNTFNKSDQSANMSKFTQEHSGDNHAKIVLKALISPKL
jgi:glycosyltransferase involved in cell wall biosynthesis